MSDTLHDPKVRGLLDRLFAEAARDNEREAIGLTETSYATATSKEQADALVDATTMIDAGAPIWLMTPKTGREGYVEPSEIGEAASTAGLAQTSSVSFQFILNIRASAPQAVTAETMSIDTKKLDMMSTFSVSWITRACSRPRSSES